MPLPTHRRLALAALASAALPASAQAPASQTWQWAEGVRGARIELQ